MCKLISMILTKKEVYFLDSGDSHEEIIEKFKLKEYNSKKELNFVRVEITPGQETTDFFDWSEEALSRWTYKVDQDILPNWYVAEYDEKRAREYLPIVLKERIKDNIWGGSLNLSYSKITKLSAGLHIGNWLNLSYSNITELPAGLRVGGSLDLSYTNIIELPLDMHVGNWLDLSYTNIIELPAGLYVGGGLSLRGTKITELPADIHVGGVIYKDF